MKFLGKLGFNFRFFRFLGLLGCLSSVCSIREYTKDDIFKLREEVREMFSFAYDSYLKYAGDYDELRPISCDGVNTWGSYKLTLIDALDTLAVMGNYTEFQRVVNLLIQDTNFDRDINVSVFETNIRIVGGLLSAHLLSHKAQLDLEPGWPCNGPLLRMAEDVAKRLLPAFDTKTGMPYGTINLKYGVPSGETAVTCTAGIGTFCIEFGALSRLTGDPIYEEVALNALYALYNHRSNIGLFGNHIDVQTGRWTAQDAGIGAGVDSYYEYLVKGSIMLNKPELMEMFNEGRKAIDKYLKKDNWHIWASMNKGQMTLPVFQSLEAYWPGVLSLFGDVNAAMKSLHNYHKVWKQYGFLPEFYNIPQSEAPANRENYPLRPELIESVQYLYRATGDPYLLVVGEDMLRSIQYSARTECGYATIKNVRDHRKEDRMESFFLAETTKYLYLLFDPDNFLNSDGGSGRVINTPNGECIIEAGGYIFNTEAHPIDPSALKCCHDMPKESLLKGFNRKKFMGEVFEFTAKADPEEHEPMFNESPVPKPTQDDPVQAANDFKKTLVNEIMNALADAKSKIEENEELKSKFQEMTNREKNGYFDKEKKSVEIGKTQEGKVADDSLVIAVTDDAQTNTPLEIVKLPKTTDKSKVSEETSFAEYEENSDLNSQNNDSNDEPTIADLNESENDDTKSSEESEGQKPQSSHQDLLNIVNTSMETNNSILSEFVQSILKTKYRKKFDPQDLRDKIKNNSYYRNQTWNTNYELLMCKSQPYLQRMSALGEYF